jgi:Ni/Fe-hydrogenase subunit HybB-like protein
MQGVLPGVDGFMYPNEIELQWSILIVLYPFLTGLVAGAFILASLERVFDVRVVKPTYRLALLTALAFLIVAPLPLQLHLGHPERSLQMYLTPHRDSAMAMFGFVYLWYLMGILVIEIWLDYRRDIVRWWKESRGWRRAFYAALALGVDNVGPRALRIDDRVARAVTIVGIPSAFLLHGYVGFIFGSVKANPWWSTPMMPVVFIFSAIVSGIALVLLLYMATSWVRGRPIDMPCLDTVAKYLFYGFLVAFALEALDLVHRIYEADESFLALDFMVKTRLYFSQIVVQILIGTLLPDHAAGRYPAVALRGAGPPVDLRHGGVAGAHRNLRDALERRDWRAAVLEELPRVHDLQDGLRRGRGPAAGHHRDAAAVRGARRAPARPAAMGRSARPCGLRRSATGHRAVTSAGWPAAEASGSCRPARRRPGGWRPARGRGRGAGTAVRRMRPGRSPRRPRRS